MALIPAGDPRLLEHEVARKLLASTELARVAYTAKDGTPRVVPMMFLWTGDELVLSAFDNTFKVAALQARPELAVSIDTVEVTPQALALRGTARLTPGEGVGPEFADITTRYLGPDFAAVRVADARRLGLRSVRIALRPSWVNVIDFQTRFPGDRTPEDFQRTHFDV